MVNARSSHVVVKYRLKLTLIDYTSAFAIPTGPACYKPQLPSPSAPSRHSSLAPS